MTFTRFSVEPIMPTFQVGGKRWPGAFLSFFLFLHAGDIAFSIPAHRLSYVPPGRSGSSSPVPAYSGSNPELQVSGLFQNHR
ncbi:hypothetical protein T05_11923 [Trichinella murrelli]|uniref:Uncharacterized protein n=1 Tax=Trichinella murrelli TaxID=144512 RepID=A0A0V0SV14_9BILA|nr:hypothetical protein T05_11923 [Trichinella murrelli]